MISCSKQLICSVGLFLAISTGLFPITCRSYAEEAQDVEGEQKTLVLTEGVSIQNIAKEPIVIDPVDIAFDEFGRLWVAEMRDYPNGPAEGEKPISLIKVLRDNDGDGIYESATVFADELLFVTGMFPWKGGVIVTLSGKIEWMIDRDGDDKVDHREVWLDGFAEKNPQLRANHLTLGPDGWFYVANGLRGGAVNVVRKDWPQLKEPIQLRGRDFRFHPQTGACEAIAGNGQYGMSFDEWGNRIICSNRNPAMQIMLQYKHLALQPKLPIRSLVQDISPAGVDSKLFPLSANWTTSNLHAGQYSAACGVHIYQGDALPAKFKNRMFVCDPTANLVHQDELQIDDATFSAVNPYQQKEFLASTSEWFRAVNLQTGPDGCLYVVDMYRAVIEHPQFMPDELKNRPDLTLGNNLGRLWRLYETGKKLSRPAAETTLPAKASTAQLIQWLQHENIWQREVAYRKFVERQDASVAPELARLLTPQTRPAAYILALRLLDQLNALSDEQLLAGIAHADPKVRFNALKISDSRLNPSGTGRETDSQNVDSPLAKAAVLALQDKHPHVRYQAMLVLRSLADKVPLFVTTVRKSILLNSSGIWSRQASLLGLHGEKLNLLHLMVYRANSIIKTESQKQTQREYLNEISYLIGRASDDESATMVLMSLFPIRQTGLDQQLVSAAIVGLGNGLRSRGKSVTALLKSPVFEKNSKYQQYIKQLLADARQNKDHDLKIRSLQTARFIPGDEVTGLLVEFVKNHQLPADVRGECLKSLRGRTIPQSEKVIAEFVEMIRSESPRIRRELIDYSLSNKQATVALLSAMDAGELNFRELASVHLRVLSRSKDKDIKALYTKLQKKTKDTNLEKLIADYLKVLSQADMTDLEHGSPERGREIFKSQCSSCHRIGNEGVSVAPDISDTRVKRPSDLLTNILDPNRAIDNNYFSYTAVTTDGKVYTGVLAEETPFAITLKQAKGETVTLQRDDIEEFASDGVSFMPKGLEKNITPEQMVDLISYLKNWRYLNGKVPLK